MYLDGVMLIHIIIGAQSLVNQVYFCSIKRLKCCFVEAVVSCWFRKLSLNGQRIFYSNVQFDFKFNPVYIFSLQTRDVV